jgi:hypothetical protein
MQLTVRKKKGHGPRYKPALIQLLLFESQTFISLYVSEIKNKEDSTNDQKNFSQHHSCFIPSFKAIVRLPVRFLCFVGELKGFLVFCICWFPFQVPPAF